MAKRFRGRRLPLILTLLILLFCWESIYPRMVFCNKADGLTLIELEFEPGPCRCAVCEDCRDRRLLEILGEEPDAPVLPKQGPCQHEDIHSEAVSNAASLLRKPILPGPAQAVILAHSEPSLPGLVDSRVYERPACLALHPPPYAGSVLRC